MVDAIFGMARLMDSTLSASRRACGFSLKDQ